MIVFALSQEAPKLDVSVPLAPSILMPQLCKVFIQHGRGTCPSRISYHTDISVPRSTADRLRDAIQPTHGRRTTPSNDSHTSCSSPVSPHQRWWLPPTPNLPSEQQSALLLARHRHKSTLVNALHEALEEGNKDGRVVPRGDILAVFWLVAFPVRLCRSTHVHAAHAASAAVGA